MVECLRKPGNKLIKKKQKLQIKIKYFQEKISDILGNKQIITPTEKKSLPKTNVVQKSNIIIQTNSNPYIALTRSNINGSAFRKY